MWNGSKCHVCIWAWCCHHSIRAAAVLSVCSRCTKSIISIWELPTHARPRHTNFFRTNCNNHATAQFPHFTFTYFTCCPCTARGRIAQGRTAQPFNANAINFRDGNNSSKNFCFVTNVKCMNVLLLQSYGIHFGPLKWHHHHRGRAVVAKRIFIEFEIKCRAYLTLAIGKSWWALPIQTL